MNYQQLHSNRDRISKLFDLYKVLPDDEIIRAHWCRYLCVLSSGYVELAVRIIFHDYAVSKSNPHVAAYVDSQLRRPININMERLTQITVAFNKAWVDELHESPNFERFKAAIDSINVNRNQIAHGENTGISYVTIREYHDGALELLDFLYSQTSGENS